MDQRQLLSSLHLGSKKEEPQKVVQVLHSSFSQKTLVGAKDISRVSADEV